MVEHGRRQHGASRACASSQTRALVTRAVHCKELHPAPSGLGMFNNSDNWGLERRTPHCTDPRVQSWLYDIATVKQRQDVSRIAVNCRLVCTGSRNGGSAQLVVVWRPAIELGQRARHTRYRTVAHRKYLVLVGADQIATLSQPLHPQLFPAVESPPRVVVTEAPAEMLLSEVAHESHEVRESVSDCPTDGLSRASRTHFSSCWRAVHRAAKDQPV